VNGLANAVTAAKGAVSQSQSSAAAAERAAGQTTATAPPAATAPKATVTTPAGTANITPRTPAAKPAKPAVPSDPSQAILAALGKDRVAVVLFFNPLGADDAAVRRAVHGLDRFGGRLTVHTAPIAKVGDYARITQGVQVLQAPTLLVIGADKRARRIVGLTDTREIQQLVGDVGGKRFIKP
jgi:hypothetical protein